MKYTIELRVPANNWIEPPEQMKMVPLKTLKNGFIYLFIYLLANGKQYNL